MPIAKEHNHTDFQLHNLRPFSHENTLREAEKNNIWIPSITFANTATMVTREYPSFKKGWNLAISIQATNNHNVGTQPEGQRFFGDCGKVQATNIFLIMASK